MTPIDERRGGAVFSIHSELVDTVVDKTTPGVSGSAPVDIATPEFWMTTMVIMMPTTNE